MVLSWLCTRHNEFVMSSTVIARNHDQREPGLTESEEHGHILLTDVTCIHGLNCDKDISMSNARKPGRSVSSNCIIHQDSELVGIQYE